MWEEGGGDDSSSAVMVTPITTPTARFFACKHAFHDTCLASYGIGRGAAHAATQGLSSKTQAPSPLGSRSRNSSSASLTALVKPVTATNTTTNNNTTGWRGGTLVVSGATRSSRSSFDEANSHSHQNNLRGAGSSSFSSSRERGNSGSALFDAVDAALDAVDCIGLNEEEEATVDEIERAALRREGKVVARLRCPLCRNANKTSL